MASRQIYRQRFNKCCLCPANRNNYFGPVRLFPSKERERLLWCVNLNLDPNEIASQPLYVCGRHFLPSFFHFDTAENMHSKLIYGAYPSLIKESDWNKLVSRNIK